MIRTPLAHAASIAGHPALLLPLAAGLAAARQDASSDAARVIILAAGAVAAAVAVFSLVQVRRGKWADSDASAPAERSQLNLFLAPLLAAAAGWAAWSGQPVALVAGLGAAAALAGAALAASPWLKLSLHTAFAVFAASLFWPDPILVPGGLGLAALIAWSRLHLARHTLLDVVAGAVSGAAAGAGLQFFLSFS